MSSSDWVYDKKEMARAFNRKTKGILINTPHNPTGKVFTKEELQFIADLAIKWNALVVTDEVYEWLVYKPNKHVRMGTVLMSLRLNLYKYIFSFQNYMTLNRLIYSGITGHVRANHHYQLSE